MPPDFAGFVLDAVCRGVMVSAAVRTLVPAVAGAWPFAAGACLVVVFPAVEAVREYPDCDDVWEEAERVAAGAGAGVEVTEALVLL